ncbi:MAG TPA: sigma 54-interacting transcriptional regulator [Vicinamibacterales bacterium]|nr:sigma 54-interacting transcriptional regulator [Vicinamibacterales bacterium]
MPDSNIADAAARFIRKSDQPVELTGRSPAIARVQELVRRAARFDGSALITAEPGASVDDVARELHLRSRASSGPFIVVDCDAADAASIDGVLFGALPQGERSDLESVARESAIAAAHGGTLFLKNVTELRASTQVQLARIARDGEVRIDGVPVATAVRFVASATPAIDADVHGQRFRRDLFRRLSAIRIDLPPLRDRADDLPAIAVRVLEDACAAAGRPPAAFSKAALALVGALTWPGNLAELSAVIEHVAADAPCDVIQIEHLLPVIPLSRAATPLMPPGNLREARLRFERDYISSVLQHHDWHMADAARTLGIQRPNLYRKARQLGIPLMRSTE